MRRHHARMTAWLPAALGVVMTTLLAGVASGLLPQPRWPPLVRKQAPADDARAADQAEQSWRQASQFLRHAKQQAGLLSGAEGAADPSGLLGADITPLVTTLGSLEAKRLSASPAWARALTTQLWGAGVGRGSVVAASCSGSFPALNLALACACRALGAELITISSVTSSTWGANQPGFTWPEMEARLVEAGLISAVSVGVATGGENDQAAGLAPDARALAEQIGDRAAAQLRASRLKPATFQQAVALRMALFDRAAGGRPIMVYVNIGGSQASVGRSMTALKLKSGWLDREAFADPGDDGVMALLAKRGVRILHLLNIRDLAAQWGVL